MCLGIYGDHNDSDELRFEDNLFAFETVSYVFLSYYSWMATQRFA